MGLSALRRFGNKYRESCNEDGLKSAIVCLYKKGRK